MDKIKESKYLAVDLGASSGRAIIGTFEVNKLKLEEIYRFPNEGIQIGKSLYWDLLALFKEIKNALSVYVKKYGSALSSIGIDTWGVDFVLLDENDELICPIHHYRDKRTEGMIEEMCKIVPKQTIFNQTGIQFMEINSSTQIFSMVKNKSPRLRIAKKFIMLPDYFNYLLSGVIISEFSDATTTQLYNPIKKKWAYDLIEKLGLKSEWFQKIVPGGTIIGPIQEEIAKEAGLTKNTKIIAPLTHDTGSAYVAVPVDMAEYKQGEYAILSSGTWSLLGVEIPKPIISEKALKYNYTNEGGINGTIRFLKNITGMWLIQECKKLWDKDNIGLVWENIELKALNEQAFQFFINPDDPTFMNPSNMINAIKDYCKNTLQDIPETIGQISRTIFECLAFKYREVLENLEDIVEKKIRILHIIGGGSQNTMLNQFTANALNIPVKAGPKEATAIGNLLVQALCLKKIKNLVELREIVKNSFPITEFTPQEVKNWNDAYTKYLQTIKLKNSS
jgi:rhamnulokinase